MKFTHSTESGQIMMLLALAFVGLLGFTALAIDLGMVYADRRAEQNAADAAALAGMQVGMQSLTGVTYTNFQCSTNGAWVTSTSGWSAPAWLTPNVLNSILHKSLSIAHQNGYDLELGLENQNGIAFRCGTLGGEGFIEVGVKITAGTATNFLQIFNGTTRLVNTVEAAARGKPNQPGLAGMALYAVDGDCSKDGGLVFKGGGDPKVEPNVEITNGGSYTRSCLHGNNNSHVFIQADPKFGNNCAKNQAHLADWCDDVGGPSSKFSPAPRWAASDPLANFKIETPNCSDRSIAPARSVSGALIDPGYYTSLGKNPRLSLKPGLYCFDFGGDLKLSGGDSLTSIAYGPYTEGVTIVLMEGTTITSTGNGFLTLKASKLNAAKPAPSVVPGLVMVSNSATTGIDFSGNAQALLWGTVYMPKSHVGLGGTGDVRTASQLIVFGFDQHGTSTLKLDYDESWFVQSPRTLSLSK